MENEITELKTAVPFKINTGNSDRITVSARDLHKFLEVETDFPHWFQRMTEYGFTEGVDFATFLSESTGELIENGWVKF